MSHVPPIKNAKIIQHIRNDRFRRGPFPNAKNNLNDEVIRAAQTTITDWPGYTPTPLISLETIAAACGVRAVYYKDESHRFGLKSFKALGGAYAVAQLVNEEKKAGRDPSKLTVTTATDGNHGRSVSWGAQLAGCRAEIYIHKHVSTARETAMADYGANVTRVNGNYEASLAACKADAAAYGWHIISDTSWDGYRDIPLLIMAGYTLIGREVIDQLGAETLTHCFLPVGVGGLASGIVAPLWQHMNENLPSMISVESHMSACFLESIAAQTPTLVDITQETLMAGLSCGEVSQLAWELLQPSLRHCLAIDDAAVAPLMARFADGTIGGVPIEAGECATSGLAALLAAKQDPQCWQNLGFNSDSVILLIGSEGATDADIYAELTSLGQK
jgi:diaminopropionate ammonia-lyase